MEKMSTEKCLAIALYEPLKYIANTGNGSHDLVTFCRSIIARIEDSSNWDYARFEELYGKELKVLLRKLIVDSQKDAFRLVGFNSFPGTCIVCGAQLEGISHAIIEGPGYPGCPVCKHHLTRKGFDVKVHFDAEDHSKED